MGRIRCFMLTPTNREARFLRRFMSADVGNITLCEPQGYHDALVRVDDGTYPQVCREDPEEYPASDPRWPTRCQHCGYEFHANEVRQLFCLRIYTTPEGQEVTIHGSQIPGLMKAPAGSMWFADWLTPYLKADGHCLCVRTPGGDWLVDGPSTNGPGWTRTGTPPLVTARPSILITGKYHGFLTDGELVEC